MRKHGRAQRGSLMAVVFFAAAAMGAQEPKASWRSRELARFKAPEAKQGVAVDEEFFYAIGNRELAKYRKQDGVRVARWADEAGGRFVHLNAGVVKGGKLYVAHSNFPRTPMVSSVEIWDAGTLSHIESHSFGETDGSLTWVDTCQGQWYAGFAHYAGRGGVPGSGPERTRVAQFDRQWRRVKEWTFPQGVSARFAPNSCSCGGFGPGGFLYATGHDARELYVLKVPPDQVVLEWVATVPVGFEGQGFAWEPGPDGTLYAISRSAQEVVAVAVTPPVSIRSDPAKRIRLRNMFQTADHVGLQQAGFIGIEEAQSAIRR
jgi:hypothetical protein